MMIEFDGGIHFNNKIYQCLMLNLTFLRIGAFCKTKLWIFRGKGCLLVPRVLYLFEFFAFFVETDHKMLMAKCREKSRFDNGAFEVGRRLSDRLHSKTALEFERSCDGIINVWCLVSQVIIARLWNSFFLDYILHCRFQLVIRFDGTFKFSGLIILKIRFKI